MFLFFLFNLEFSPSYPFSGFAIFTSESQLKNTMLTLSHSEPWLMMSYCMHQKIQIIQNVYNCLSLSFGTKTSKD